MHVRRKSKHRSSNCKRARRTLCAASREWADQTQLLGRKDRAKRAEDALEAECAEIVPPPAKVVPDHTLEVRVRIDDCERTFRAVCVKGEWIGDSGNVITKAIRLVMAAGARA